MKRPIAATAGGILAGWLVACTPVPPLSPPDPGPRVHEARVIGNGWHSAIVVPRPALAATGLLPEAADFPDAAFLEFGWGDRTYYPARDKTLGMTLAAALIETPAVMHVAGLSPAQAFARPGYETVSIFLSDGSFRRLVAAIAGDIDRGGGARANPVAPGLYADSRFYHAHGAFHLFNTCNTWTARTLRAAGIDVSPAGVVTADELMARVRAAAAARRAVGLLP